MSYRPTRSNLRICAPLEAPPFHLFLSPLFVPFLFPSVAPIPNAVLSDFPRQCVFSRAKYRQNAGAKSGGGARDFTHGLLDT